MAKFKLIGEREKGIEQHVVELNGQRYLVSTVNLLPPAMEKSFSEEVVKKVKKRGEFETSVFPFHKGQPDLSDVLYSARYESEEEAVKGHEKVLNKIKKGKMDL